MKKIILAAFCVTSALPALAADNFTKGCAFYNAGQYMQALPYFQDTVSKKPRYWQGHYYLANTYSALGQRDEAVEQYQATQMYHPTPEVAKACQDAASRIASHALRSSGMPSYSGQSASYNKYIADQKQKIMDGAMREAQLLRDNTNRQLESQTNTAGGLGSFSPSATEGDKKRARDIQQKTETEAKAKYETARKQMRDLR